jgi:hypothetical protein
MTTQQFIFEEPLYKKVKISENPDILDDLLRCISIDGFNSRKGIDSTFRLSNHLLIDYIRNNSTEQIIFVCQRYNDRLYVQIHYDKVKDFIEKVGQYPSVADIQIAQIKQYSKVLDNQYMKDFTKAIGLAANGIGTGSFVYLRRIFEYLVSEAAKEAIANGDVDEHTFKTSKMDNKLKQLEKYLPDVLKDNKPLYGVLSKGIHELSEEECLDYFSVVREIIELILDEREFLRQQEEKKKRARSNLSKIAGELNK